VIYVGTLLKRNMDCVTLVGVRWFGILEEESNMINFDFPCEVCGEPSSQDGLCDFCWAEYHRTGSK
jgi:hypothetical protein